MHYQLVLELGLETCETVASLHPSRLVLFMHKQTCTHDITIYLWYIHDPSMARELLSCVAFSMKGFVSTRLGCCCGACYIHAQSGFCPPYLLHTQHVALVTTLLTSAACLPFVQEQFQASISRPNNTGLILMGQIHENATQAASCTVAAEVYFGPAISLHFDFQHILSSSSGLLKLHASHHTTEKSLEVCSTVLDE